MDLVEVSRMVDDCKLSITAMCDKAIVAVWRSALYTISNVYRESRRWSLTRLRCQFCFPKSPWYDIYKRSQCRFYLGDRSCIIRHEVLVHLDNASRWRSHLRWNWMRLRYRLWYHSVCWTEVRWWKLVVYSIWHSWGRSQRLKVKPRHVSFDFISDQNSYLSISLRIVPRHYWFNIVLLLHTCLLAYCSLEFCRLQDLGIVPIVPEQNLGMCLGASTRACPPSYRKLCASER